MLERQFHLEDDDADQIQNNQPDAHQPDDTQTAADQHAMIRRWEEEARRNEYSRQPEGLGDFGTPYTIYTGNQDVPPVEPPSEPAYVYVPSSALLEQLEAFPQTLAFALQFTGVDCAQVLAFAACQTANTIPSQQNDAELVRFIQNNLGSTGDGY